MHLPPLSQRTRGDCSGKDFTLSASGNDSTSEDMNTEVAKIVAIKKIHGWGNMV